MTTSNQNPATEAQDLVAIPKNEFPEMIWKLKAIENTFRFLHNRLKDLQKSDESPLMTAFETAGFSNVFFEAYEPLHEIVMELIQADDCALREIGEQLMEYVDIAGFALNFFTQREKFTGKLDHNGVYSSDLPGILLLTNEICSKGLPCYIKLLEETISSETASNDQELHKDCSESYESRMAKHARAIEPEFKRFYDKYTGGDGCEILSDPEKFRLETKKIRDEIWQLQNQMPVSSEEAMDCRLAVDQFDFLIRLIDSKFAFKNSDIVTLSVIVDRANSVFSSVINLLTLGEGGGNAEDTVH